MGGLARLIHAIFGLVVPVLFGKVNRAITFIRTHAVNYALVDFCIVRDTPVHFSRFCSPPCTLTRPPFIGDSAAQPVYFPYTPIKHDEENQSKPACLLRDSGRASYWPAEGSCMETFICVNYRLDHGYMLISNTKSSHHLTRSI